MARGANDSRQDLVRPDAGSGAIACRLLRWQSEGDTDDLAEVVRTSLPLLQRFAALTLRRYGIADSSAADDAVSLVLDHLRRLPGAAAAERRVAPFRDARVGRGRRGPGHHADEAGDDDAIDAGFAYLRWLVRDRAADVARSRRREARRAVTFSDLNVVDGRLATAATDSPPDPDSPGGPPPVREAVARLEPRLRRVIELLLDGNSQSSIAATLHVCEGTVSRLRRRAIESLRHMLGE